jgi:hypothetical protein
MSRIGNLNINCNDTSEARLIYNEIFKKHIYDFSYYDANFAPTQILDVGAYLGISTIWFANELKVPIVAIEANPLVFRIYRIMCF